MHSLFSFESTALRLITSIGSAEFQPQFSRYFNDKSPVPLPFVQDHLGNGEHKPSGLQVRNINS